MIQLFELPEEIQDEIFNKCKTKDLKTLACCSSTCNEALKQTLWANLHIPWHYLLSSLHYRRPEVKRRLEKVRYARHLTFYTRMLWRKGPSLPIEHSSQKLLNNFRKFVLHCDATAVHSLHIHNKPHREDGKVVDLITHACRVFRSLQEVDLSWSKDISVETFVAINTLPFLTGAGFK